jgi:DNA-binding MarR family transcriptional regulator
LEQTEIARLIGGAPRLSVEDIVGHPRFPEARKVYLDRFLEVYGGDPFLVRLLIESGRFCVYNLTVVLEAAHDPARRETWPTVGLLKQNMAMLGLASGRHVDDLIGRLCAVGHMELRPSDQDRRVRILNPTEKLRAHDRDWLAAHYAPLTVLYPEHDYGPVMRRDPNFQKVHRRTCVPFMPLGAKLLLAVPDMLLFLDRAAGYMVLAALLQAALAQPDHPHAAVPYADIGDRFGVSRTHVRRLLAAAEKAGLVKLQARGGRRVEILPRFWSSHDRGTANGMYFHDIIYLAATRGCLPGGGAETSAQTVPNHR